MSQIRADHLIFSYDGSLRPVFENAAFTIDKEPHISLIRSPQNK